MLHLNNTNVTNFLNTEIEQLFNSRNLLRRIRLKWSGHNYRQFLKKDYDDRKTEDTVGRIDKIRWRDCIWSRKDG